MPASYVVSYLLLTALAVLSVVCVVQVLRALLHRGDRRPAPGTAAEPTFRRCEACSARWRASEADQPAEVELRRLRTRRRLRRALTGTSSRRLPASWDRCPHCLSPDVRASRSNAASR